ncbi:MAG: glycoside hydrolase family 108 protein [Burkholderiales bacterium]|nr:glycoside hydrolase family 108 protein [Burkholderiales bacterium]
MTFDQVFDKLINHEGGYVFNPHDPGGETKFGISKRSYPHLDIHSLTLADAKTIYRRDFWDRAQCDKMHPDLAFDLFDGAVNSGIGQAIRWLQRAVGVADDGVVGPLTLASINRENDTSAIRARYSGHRLDFMTRLSTWDVFGKGWARRIASNLQSVGK